MQKKIKLIFFHPFSNIGGADNSLRRLVERLDLKKYSITFVSLNNSFLKKELNKNIIFKTLKAKRTLFSIFELKGLIKKYERIESFKKIILISNQNFANIITSLSVLKNNRVKKILIDRNHIDELNFSRNIWENIKRNIIKILMKCTYPNADLVIGISKKLSNDLSQFIRKKVKTIYSPGYDRQILHLAKKKIRLNKNFKYIINVSRFTKRKDHLTTLKAFQIASQKLNRLKLILIGYGPEYKNIIKNAKKLNIRDKLVILNNIKNPYPYIKKSELLLLSSRYEGMGNILVEALTLKIPVISTNCNAGPSEILLNGKGGDLVKVGDFNNMAKKIILHFGNKKILKKKTNFARKKLKRFDINYHVKLYKKIFDKI